MTDVVILKAESREVGSKNAAIARANGLMPAVIYGHKQESESISMDNKAFVEGIRAGSRLFELQFEGKTETLLVKQVQYDYLGKDIIHVDFMRVDLNERANVSIPVIIKGIPSGVAQGGIMDIHMDFLEVNATVSNVPESFVLLVKGLGLGEGIYAKDVELPEGVTLVTEAEALIVNCHLIVEKAEGEELGEPEVLTEKNKD